MRFIVVALLAVFIAAPAMAVDTYTFPEKEKAFTKKIEVDKKGEYLEITVYVSKDKTVIYRLYPCGEVQKQEWKQLAPNVEPGRTTLWPGTDGTITITPLTYRSPVQTLENKMMW